jgi:hypothetical protein
MGWVYFAPLDDPPYGGIAAFAFGLSRRTARPSRQKLGKLNLDRLAVRAFAGEVLRTRVRPDFHSCEPSVSAECVPCQNVRTSVTQFQINRDRDRPFLNRPCS